MDKEYTLIIDGQEVGLRENKDGLLAPKNKRIFDSTLRGEDIDSRSCKFLVTLVSKHNDAELLKILEEIEKTFSNRKWIFFVADWNSSKDVCDTISNHKTSASAYFPIKLKCRSIENAKKTISKISKIYCKEYPYKIDYVSNKPNNIIHKIESFCFVCTWEMQEEAAILLKSLRMFHDQPVYIFCDSETKYFLSCLGIDLKNVFFKTEMEKEHLEKINQKYDFERHNNYHKPECIIKKMDCMNYALAQHSNTFFLDSDIIILDDLNENFDKEIYLSPHYHKIGTDFSDSACKYGFFNAGYIFCANPDFPDFWKNMFLNDSKFYEQECMNQIPEKFDVGLFSELHNHGFWRQTYSLDKETKSLHVHLTNNENLNQTDLINEENNRLKRKSIDFFKDSSKQQHKDVYDFIQKINSGWGGKQENFTILESNPKGKIDLNFQTTFASHRSGWKFAVDSLVPLHNKNGVLFDGFLENNFAWHLKEYRDSKKIIPYEKPWVGFLHNPQNMPPWFFYEYSLQNIIAGPEFQKSLDTCMGLFCLSEYQAEYLSEATGKKVSTLMHPTEIPEALFNYKTFIKNTDKKIVNIGYWLRKLNSIFRLPIAKNNTYSKIRLIPYSAARPLEMIDELVEKEKSMYGIEIEEEYMDNTITKSCLSNNEYDKLLSENIIFLDLYDSSANNAIIECIARTTPLLVNPLPAVREYLGEDYPFYYDSLNEAAEKAEDLDLVKETHEYLKGCQTRQRLSQEYFKKSFEESEIYQSL